MSAYINQSCNFGMNVFPMFSVAMNATKKYLSANNDYDVENDLTFQNALKPYIFEITGISIRILANVMIKNQSVEDAVKVVVVSRLLNKMNEIADEYIDTFDTSPYNIDLLKDITNITKLIFTHKILTNESLKDSVKIVIIIESLDKSSAYVTDYLTREFLRNHPGLNAFSTSWPVEMTISALKDRFVYKIAEKIREQI
jgi:hypothetical protein